MIHKDRSAHYQRRKEIAAAFTIFFLLLSATGCYLGRDRLFSHVVRNYLHDMAEIFTDDVFTFTEVSGIPGREMAVDVTAHSEKYAKDFRITILDGLQMTDDYYLLYLAEPVQTYADEMLKKVLPERKIVSDCTVEPSGFSFSSVEHHFNSVEDMFDRFGTAPFLRLKITVRSAGDEALLQREINQVLRYLQYEGFEGIFAPADDVLWYEIRTFGITEVRRTGKDGGAMLERRDYVPDF